MENSTMLVQELYSQIIEAKTGILIPQTITNRTIESKYNPENDCKRLSENLQIEGDFIILLGIGCGLLVKELLEKYKDIFIICVENTQKDLDLISTLPQVKSLQQNKNLCFTTIEKLNETITKQFLPVFYNKFQLVENPAWVRENLKYKTLIQNEIKKAFATVSADYSVQHHFGKIWNKNILSNLKIYEKITENSITIDKFKTAAILAAGPSLDQTSNDLISNREKYFIIATDTAIGPLLKRKSYADIVVSLDGQYISSSHFLSNISEKTHYYFDICGNSSAVKKIYRKQKDNLFFFTSGHPLGSLINNNYSAFLELNSGSGTVTIAALDLACKLGFKNIQVYGADFSYIKGKTYTSGTYLDNLYNSTAEKKLSSEQMFSKLMFRAPLITKSESIKTTDILDGYRSSFENFIINSNMKILKHENNVYYIQNFKECIKTDKKNNFKYITWFNNFFEKVSDHELNSINDLQNEDIAILPLMSALKKYDNKSNTGLNELHNLAIKALKR